MNPLEEQQANTSFCAAFLRLSNDKERTVKHVERLLVGAAPRPVAELLALVWHDGRVVERAHQHEQLEPPHVGRVLGVLLPAVLVDVGEPRRVREILALVTDVFPVCARTALGAWLPWRRPWLGCGARGAAHSPRS